MFIRRSLATLVSILCSIVVSGCNSGSTADLIDVADGVPRKTIDTGKLGINAFANDSAFGSASQQFGDIRNNLRLGYVRVLIDWNSGVQSSKGASPDFGFYDHVIGSLPAGLDALLILNNVPSWMADSGQWDGGNPRATFVNEWVRPVVARYGGNGRVVGFQIWNEPNQPNPANDIMQLRASPANYVELLSLAHNVVKESAPGKLVVTAATTAINQNYPDTLDYNRGMRDAGALNVSDVYAIHYYGEQYENVVRGGGVQDFVNGLNKAVWVTESGAQGVNSQLEYGERTWPFLLEKMPNIQRIYVYQYAERTPAESTYGLRNTSAGSSVSDLYVYLRDR